MFLDMRTENKTYEKEKKVADEPESIPMSSLYSCMSSFFFSSIVIRINMVHCSASPFVSARKLDTTHDNRLRWRRATEQTWLKNGEVTPHL